MYLRCIIMATPFVYEFPATFHESYLKFGLLSKQIFYAALQKNKNFPAPKFVVTDIGWGFIAKTYAASIDEKLGIITVLDFLWLNNRYRS